MTFIGWVLCGIAIFFALLAIYSHMEGNRVSATRFVFHDIRRDMGSHPSHKVWWKAFCIAMGWRKRSRSDASSRSQSPKRNNVILIREARPR